MWNTKKIHEKCQLVKKKNNHSIIIMSTNNNNSLLILQSAFKSIQLGHLKKKSAQSTILNKVHTAINISLNFI